MSGRCLLYYITDRRAFPGDESTRWRRLLEKIAEAAGCGVDYIQLREKDLSGRELEKLARKAVQVVCENRSAKEMFGGDARVKETAPQGLKPISLAGDSGTAGSRALPKALDLTVSGRGVGFTKLLINSRTDVALAAGADGVHLRGDDVSPAEVRAVWKCGARAPAREASAADPLLGISCHCTTAVARAAAQGAAFAVFGPVFEKKGAPGAKPAGLQALREACRAAIPVLAVGGVTLENAAACLEAGAAGIAAIRLFQENDIAGVVRLLRHR